MEEYTKEDLRVLHKFTRMTEELRELDGLRMLNRSLHNKHVNNPCAAYLSIKAILYEYYEGLK